MLTRLVMTAKGISHDPTGKKNGRGAYICSNYNCWNRAISSNLLGQALRQPLSNEDRIFLADLASKITSELL